MKKWQKLLQQAQAAAKAASDLQAKAEKEDRELSEDERTTYNEKYSEALDLKAKSDQAKLDEEQRSTLNDLADSAEDEDTIDAKSQVLGRTTVEPQAKAGGHWEVFGDRFVKSPEYQAFRKAFPSGVGSGSPVDIGRVKLGTLADWDANRKAFLGTPISQPQAIRFPTLDQVDRNNLTFLDLISRGSTAGNFEYVQITGVTRGAKIVPEATSNNDAASLKPLSEMATNIADAKVFTYADGYEVTNQLLSDAPAFASYMNNELSYSLDNVIEDKLLNGTGTAGEPKGILATSGVQQVTYTAAAVGADGMPVDATVKAFIRATRLAILGVTRLPGGTVQAIVLSPEMDAAIDLIQDGQQRYYGNGPFGSGPQTLWGRPRVTSERLNDNMALLGDFKQVALLDREGLSVMAFNQHKDYAQRNLTYVRAELRAAQVIWKPNRLAVVKPAA